jgi:hypothetical protein
LSPRLSEGEIAEQLAFALRSSAERRSHPVFGQSAVSLSGGLDSRAILCSVKDRERLWAFTFYDSENLEFNTAREIARKAGVRFLPLKRGIDHYGGVALKVAEISECMGNFGNNHYLGFRDTFEQLGVENVIAGFYFDYLFKSLLVNRTRRPLLREEVLTDFRYTYYDDHYWSHTRYDDEVRHRLQTLFPRELRSDSSDSARLEVSNRRLFPVSYEPDNLETTIPQRVMRMQLPSIDNDIISVYLKTPAGYKLNTSMYSKMVELQCGRDICNIVNVNTMARVNAGKASILFHHYYGALRRKLAKKEMATGGSWINWNYYISNSEAIGKIWRDSDERAEGILTSVLEGATYLNFSEQRGEMDFGLLLRLLTLKLWAARNAGANLGSG